MDSERLSDHVGGMWRCQLVAAQSLSGCSDRIEGVGLGAILGSLLLGSVLAVNVHLYRGGDSTYQENRRFMEALAVARWADLRRESDNAFTTNIIVLGDFNLHKADWEDPIWVVLGERGLHLAPHSTHVGGSNILDDRPYDQLAFFPGEMEDRLEASGVFDFDGAVFETLWDTHPPDDFYSYIRYYLSDHRILWSSFDIT